MLLHVDFLSGESGLDRSKLIWFLDTSVNVCLGLLRLAAEKLSVTAEGIKT